MVRMFKHSELEFYCKYFHSNGINFNIKQFKEVSACALVLNLKIMIVTASWVALQHHASKAHYFLSHNFDRLTTVAQRYRLKMTLVERINSDDYVICKACIYSNGIINRPLNLENKPTLSSGKKKTSTHASYLQKLKLINY